jgi:hypothetical protein
MTNIIPQTPKLNRGGVWRQIERLEMGMGAAFRDAWVITGPIETDHTNSLAGDVSIPEGSFKIIADQDESSNALRVQAFVIPQQPQSNDLSAYSVSVDRVEELTGLDFFPNLAGSFEDLESVRPASVWIASAGGYSSYNSAISSSSKATSSSGVQPANSSGSYWISSTGKTHRKGCRYYGKGNGSFGVASSVNCKICGGAN